MFENEKENIFSAMPSQIELKAQWWSLWIDTRMSRVQVLPRAAFPFFEKLTKLPIRPYDLLTGQMSTIRPWQIQPNSDFDQLRLTRNGPANKPGPIVKTLYAAHEDFQFCLIWWENFLSYLAILIKHQRPLGLCAEN